MAAPGTDIVLSEDKLASARNFANKIWMRAISVYELEKFEEGGAKWKLGGAGSACKGPYAYRGNVPLVDAWMFARLEATVDLVNERWRITGSRGRSRPVSVFLGRLLRLVHRWVKPELQSADGERATVAWKNLFAAFDAALRLLHPFMPFLTEERGTSCRNRQAKSIALDQFPEAHDHWTNARALEEVDGIQEWSRLFATFAQTKTRSEEEGSGGLLTSDACGRKRSGRTAGD